jgi:predicted nucleotidyltransferase
MPVKSKAQQKYIFYLRNKYENKTNTPEKYKWIWKDEWTQSGKDYDKLPDKIEESVLTEKMIKSNFNVGFELECYFTSDYDKNNFFHEAQDIFEELHEELTSKGYEVDENLIKMDNDPSIQVPEEFTTYECYSCEGTGRSEELCEECEGTGYELCPTCGGSGEILEQANYIGRLYKKVETEKELQESIEELQDEYGTKIIDDQLVIIIEEDIEYNEKEISTDTVIVRSPSGQIQTYELKNLDYVIIENMDELYFDEQYETWEEDIDSINRDRITCPDCGGYTTSDYTCDHCEGHGYQYCYSCEGTGSHSDEYLKEELTAEFQVGGNTGLPFIPYTLYKIRDLFRLFEENNGRTNSSTGLHTHISFEGMTSKDLMWFILTLANETKLYDQFKNMFPISGHFASYGLLNNMDTYLTRLVDKNDLISEIKKTFSDLYNSKFLAFKIHRLGTLEWRAVRGVKGVNDTVKWFKNIYLLLKELANSMETKEIITKRFVAINKKELFDNLDEYFNNPPSKINLSNSKILKFIDKFDTVSEINKNRVKQKIPQNFLKLFYPTKLEIYEHLEKNPKFIQNYLDFLLYYSEMFIDYALNAEQKMNVYYSLTYLKNHIYTITESKFPDRLKEFDSFNNKLQELIDNNYPNLYENGKDILDNAKNTKDLDYLVSEERIKETVNALFSEINDKTNSETLLKAIVFIFELSNRLDSTYLNKVKTALAPYIKILYKDKSFVQSISLKINPLLAYVNVSAEPLYQFIKELKLEEAINILENPDKYFEQFKELKLEKKYKFSNSETFTPPETVAKQAQRALDARDKLGRENVKGGTKVGWTRANQLAKKEPVSFDTIKRMYSFFSRHDGNQKTDKKGQEKWKDKGYTAHAIWGGDAGFSWVKGIMNRATLKESVLDPVKETLNPAIWDGMKLKADVKKRILEDIVNYLPEQYEVVAVHFLGSNTGYQYNATSDIDINVYVEGIETEQTIELSRMMPSGEKLEGTEHEVNYYISTPDYYGSRKGQGSMYDVIEDKWIVEPKKEKAKVPYSYVAEIAKVFMSGIDNRIAEYESDKEEQKLYEDYLDNMEEDDVERDEIIKRIEMKKNEVLSDLDSLYVIAKLIKSFRLDGFKDTEFAFLVDSGEGNQSIQNMVYKILERLGYTEKIYKYLNLRKEVKSLKEVKVHKLDPMRQYFMNYLSKKNDKVFMKNLNSVLTNTIDEQQYNDIISIYQNSLSIPANRKLNKFALFRQILRQSGIK